jgi:hypothetical protein
VKALSLSAVQFESNEGKNMNSLVAAEGRFGSEMEIRSRRNVMLVSARFTLLPANIIGHVLT